LFFKPKKLLSLMTNITLFAQIINKLDKHQFKKVSKELSDR